MPTEQAMEAARKLYQEAFSKRYQGDSYWYRNIATALDAARADGERAGREAAAKVADKKAAAAARSRDRARAAGRKEVASHRQSDIETANDIAAAIREQPK